MSTLNYDYTASKAFAEQLNLFWLGDDFIRAADEDAKLYNFTQVQVDIAMMHHLWQVKWLFTPKNFTFKIRLKMAFYFLTGIGHKNVR